MRVFYGWWIVLAAFLNLFFSVGILYYGFPVFYPSMVDSLGFTRSQLTQGFLMGFVVAALLFGIMAGHILRLKRTLAEKSTWLFLIGNTLLALALICNLWLPINKKLWTSSFSLFMAGLDFVMFAMMLWLVDGLGYKRVVKPLVIMGMNAIAVYVASELLDELMGATQLHTWVYARMFAGYASPMNASLLYAIGYTLLMYALAYTMYRRGWFVRV